MSSWERRRKRIKASFWGWWGWGEGSHSASPALRTRALGVRELPSVEGSHTLRLGLPSGLSRLAPPSQPPFCSPHPEGTPTTELGCPPPRPPQPRPARQASPLETPNTPSLALPTSQPGMLSLPPPGTPQDQGPSELTAPSTLGPIPCIVGRQTTTHRPRPACREPFQEHSHAPSS